MMDWYLVKQKVYTDVRSRLHASNDQCFILAITIFIDLIDLHVDSHDKQFHMIREKFAWRQIQYSEVQSIPHPSHALEKKTR